MVISLVTKLVNAITFRKVLIWTLAGIIGVVGFTAYEHRSELFNAASTGSRSFSASNPVGAIFTVSDASQKRISQFVQDDPIVVGFTAFSVDIRLNVRTAVYFYADKSEPIPPTIGPLAAINRLPIFTKNDETNRQMIKLINGEFTCSPYATTTLIATVAPTVNKDVVSVCRASLPPYYGHFSGYVSIFLKVDPDIETQLRLKTAIELLATEIYFRDVIPTTHSAKLG